MYAQAQTPQEIDKSREMKMKIADTDAGDNWVSTDMPVICIPIRMMIDMMAFTDAYGHKSMLDSPIRTLQAFRTTKDFFLQ